MAEGNDELPMSMRKTLEHFRVAIDLYRIRNFKEAKVLFSQALEYESNDNPAKVYLARCEEFLERPSSEDWDGCFTLTEE